jgi:hypothetical protein
MIWLAAGLVVMSIAFQLSPVALFLGFAAFHCVFGYIGAFVSEEHIFSVFSHHQAWFAQAAFVVALGLFAMSMAYRTFRSGVRTWVTELSIDPDRLCMCARIAVLLGMALTTYLLSQMSLLDVVAEQFGGLGQLRYMGTEGSLTAWVSARALDLFAYSIPLLWMLRRRRADIVLIVLGAIPFLLLLRRAAILSAILVPLLAARRINYKIVVVALLIGVSVYSASQLFLLDSGSDAQPAAVFSAFPEIRDLGWVMSLMRDDYLGGTTLIQPLVPLPSFISDWKTKHTMEHVTGKLIGLDDPDSRSFAGLRVTMAGEAFMNWWFIGPPIFGFLLGMGAAWAERSLLNSRTTATRYISATLMVWICFWLYMGGTQALGTVKFGALMLSAMCFYSFVHRNDANPVTDHAHRN